ncbi:MAG: prepilin peptidase [Gemmatimonadetes bacterium]|nr:MAG: prepilin peptidase [Gemmatimonadota bacterium]
MPAAVFYPIWFVFGAMWGSFINVCIYRIPRRESIVFPASHCPHCGTPIKPYDNIPILSWLVLKGKCRACHKPISIQYPIVELISGVVFMLVFYRTGWSSQLPVYLFFSVYLLIGALTDLFTFFDPPRTELPVHLILPRITLSAAEPPTTELVWEGVISDETYAHENPNTETVGIGQPIEPVQLPPIHVKPIMVEKGIIPDEISIGGIIIGVLLALISEQTSFDLMLFPREPLLEAVLGFFAGAGSLYLLSVGYRLLKGIDGMGMGDVKYLGMIGVFLGWKAVIVTILVGSVVSLLVTVPYLLRSKMGSQSPMPFGPSLAVGALVALAFGDVLFLF